MLDMYFFHLLKKYGISCFQSSKVGAGTPAQKSRTQTPIPYEIRNRRVAKIMIPYEIRNRSVAKWGIELLRSLRVRFSVLYEHLNHRIINIFTNQRNETPKRPKCRNLTRRDIGSTANLKPQHNKYINDPKSSKIKTQHQNNHGRMVVPKFSKSDWWSAVFPALDSSFSSRKAGSLNDASTKDYRVRPDK